MSEQAIFYARDHYERSLGELFELLRIPSISTLPEMSDQMRQAAEWLSNKLQRIGLQDVSILPTAGHPIVFAQHVVNPTFPTVLIYGHYDVQPPDPLEQWTSHPFEPTLVGENIVCRGASDDKGQLFMHIAAVEALLATGSLPVNLKMLIEGEEEIGSKNFDAFVRQNRDMLSADIVVLSDGAMLDEHTPSIARGLRGLVYAQIEVTGPSRDLHSGHYGGAVPNPITVLTDIISAMHDAQRRVMLPGFYDKVRPFGADEIRDLARIPFDQARWLADIGLSASSTPSDISAYQAVTSMPALDPNGIWAGYQGKGAKTVIPSQAFAKISARLVPDQTVEDVSDAIRSFVENATPSNVKSKVEIIQTIRPILFDSSGTGLAAASKALESVFGRQAIFIRGGGSIGVVSTFKQELDLEVVMLGFGLPADRTHSPNEQFSTVRFRQGTETSIRFMSEVANSETQK